MMLMSCRAFAVTSAAVALAWSCTAQAQGAARAEQIATLFQNVRIFDGKSDALGPATNVLVRGNTIEKISKGPIVVDGKVVRTPEARIPE